MGKLKHLWRRIVSRFQKSLADGESRGLWNESENSEEIPPWTALGQTIYNSNPGDIIYYDGTSYSPFISRPPENNDGAINFNNYYANTSNVAETYTVRISSNTVDTIANMHFDRPNQLVVTAGQIDIGNVDQPQVNVNFDSSYWRPRVVEHPAGYSGFVRRGTIILERIPRWRSEHAVDTTGTHNEPAPDSIHSSEDVLLGWDAEQNT